MTVQFPPWTRSAGSAVALVGTVAAALVVGLSGREATGGDATIEVSVSRCGQGWTHPRAGEQTFQMHNSDSRTAEVELIDPASGAVFGEVEGLAPGTTRPMRVLVGRGTYAFRCGPDGTDPITGPRVSLGGGGAGGPAVVPVTQNDLLGPLHAYQAYVAAGLDTLVVRTDALREAVRSGDLGAGRAGWLPAHLAYERLGAAYGTFDEFDARINGRPDGLPGGVNDPDFTGFHRVERGLWHGEPAASLQRVTDRLDREVRELRAAFPRMEIDPNDLSLRAHEIMENALQFELTGASDQGSGTSLATAAANLDGTRAVLAVLHPLLADRYPGLAGVDAWTNRVASLLAAARGTDGRWTPAMRLGATQHARLDGAVGELLERLAPIAVIGEARRTS